MDFENTSSASSGVPITRSSDSFLVVTPTHPGEPTSANQQQSTGPILYAKFKIGEAVFGDEPVKPLTYFPITCELVPSKAEVVVAQTIPLHFRQVPQVGISQKPVRFENAITTVERRYSELVTYRQLLSLLYPGLVLPALPEKNSIDNLQTYWQNKTGLKQQQRNVGRFLRGLAAIPEVMLFTEWTQPMFQLPRETFADHMGRMRELVSILKARIASLDQHRPVRQTNSSSAVGALAAESTRVVRSLVGTISSWYSLATQSTSTQSLQARIDDCYKRSTEVAFWNGLEQQLTDRKNGLLVAADQFLAFLSHQAQISQAMADVGEAMEGFSVALNEAPEVAQYSPPVTETKAVHCAAEMTQCIANAHHAECDKWFTAVYEAIVGEINEIDAAVDAMDFARCLLRQRYEAEVEAAGGSSGRDIISFALQVHERLSQDMKFRFLVNFRRKMVGTSKSLTTVAIQFAAKEEEQAGKCAFHRLMLDQNYSTF